MGSANPTAEANASPSATPEPTIAPADAFVDYLTESHFTATAELSGTLAVNTESREVTGEWTVSGADFHTVLDFGEAVGRVEQAVVDGQNYVRPPSMPWRRDIQASIPSDTDFASVLATLNWEPADEGSTSVADSRLVASGRRIEAVMTLLGLVDQSVEMEHGTLTVSVDRRGVPTEFHLEAEVHRVAGDVPLVSEWDLVYALHKVGRLTTVKKPEVWLPHESSLGYSMHHPASWSVTREPATAEFMAYDLYLSPISGEVHVTLFEGLDPGLPANGWLQGSAANFNDWAGTPEEVESLTVGGVPALLLATHYSDRNGEWWIMVVSIVGVGRAWDIQTWSLPGTEPKARETLDLFLATFEISES